MKLSAFPLDDSPGYILFRSAARMKAELLRAFRANGFDVTPEQWAVLNKLWEIEGLNQMELAEKTSKDRPTMTRILKLLEDKKWIIRKPDRKDNRCFGVYLTPGGKGLKKKLIPIVVRHLERAFAGFGKEELKNFRRTHERVVRNLGKARGKRAKSGDHGKSSPSEICSRK